jgi:hypothetical protein
MIKFYVYKFPEGKVLPERVMKVFNTKEEAQRFIVSKNDKSNRRLESDFYKIVEK